MKKWLATLLSTLLLNYGEVSYAMDYPTSNDTNIPLDDFTPESTTHFTVGEAIELLDNSFHEEVPLYAGCCFAEANGQCSIEVCALYWVFGLVGFAVLISAATTTGVAFPERYPRREFNPELFIAGMSLWGAFFFTVLFPPTSIPLANSIKNMRVRSRNASIEKIKNLLVDTVETARLSERLTYNMDFILIEADKKYFSKLDSGQALTLALRHGTQLQQRDEDDFSPSAVTAIVCLKQILQMSEWERRQQFADPEMQSMISQNPPLFFALEALLPFYAALPHSYMPHLYENFLANYKDGTYHNTRYNPEVHRELNEDVTLLLDGEDLGFRASKEALAQICQTLQDMISDLGSDSSFPDTLPLANTTPAMAKILIQLSQLSPQEREHFSFSEKKEIENHLKIHRIYVIKFIFKAASDYYLKYGISGTWAEQFKITYDYELKDVRKKLKSSFAKKLSSLELSELEFKGLDMLRDSHRTKILQAFPWENLFAKFNSEPKFLATCWEHANKCDNKDFFIRLIDYREDKKNSKVVAHAWPPLKAPPYQRPQ